MYKLYSLRHSMSAMLVVSMIFSLYLTVAPVQRAEAGLFSALAGLAKSMFITVGGLATGAAGSVIGMAVGGGPLGMAVGGLAGFIVGKKVLKWTTASVANVATVAGAIGGGLLCAGMGFPMLAAGVLGGGLIARLVTKGIGKIFSKIGSWTVSRGDVNSEDAELQAAEAEQYMMSVSDNSQSTYVPGYGYTYENKQVPTVSSVGAPRSSQEAYARYTAAYNAYTAATERGDTRAAEASLRSYREYFRLYREMMAQGY